MVTYMFGIQAVQVGLMLVQLLVHKDHRVRKVRKVQLVRKVHKAGLVHKVHKDHRVHKVLKDHKVLLAQEPMM
jgi:hypothetical protein